MLFSRKKGSKPLRGTVCFVFQSLLFAIRNCFCLITELSGGLVTFSLRLQAGHSACVLLGTFGAEPREQRRWWGCPFPAAMGSLATQGCAHGSRVGAAGQREPGQPRAHTGQGQLLFGVINSPAGSSAKPSPVVRAQPLFGYKARKVGQVAMGESRGAWPAGWVCGT